MIHFYYRADSDATSAALIDAVKQRLAEGARVLLLVPEQGTVTVERRMLRVLPPSAQLSFEVVNFSRLANRVFRETGGHRWHTATPAVRSLLMWQTLRSLAPMLARYGQNATQPRLCDMMLEMASRCRAYGIDANALLTAADALDEEDALKDKLLDIGTVLGVFERSLAEQFDNGDDDLDRLAEVLATKGEALFADTHVFVDAFTDFTAQEKRILEALAKSAASVSFTFPLDSPRDEGLHLEASVRTHRELHRMADELSLSIEMHPSTEDRPRTAREYLARHLFRMDAEPAPLALLEEHADVKLFCCETPFAEANAAVAEIQRLVRGGARYRDIAVILRDATASIGILDAALEREGIPFFLSEKTDVTVRPLVKMILLALRIHLYGWRDEDVIAYLKTGLCGVSADDVNLFEEYADVWHPRGLPGYRTPFDRNPNGFTLRRDERGERILAGANRARETLLAPLLGLFEALDSAASTEEMCRAIYAYLDALGVRGQLKQRAADLLAAGERREAEELSRLYAVTVEALESIALAIGKERLTTAQLIEALRLVFSKTDIGSIPTSSDEVTVGSASMLRADHPRFVLVLGLNEGEFPRPVTDDALLSEEERERLASFDIAFPAGRAEQSSNELFYLHRAFAAPREGLYLSYSKFSTSGAALSPSIAVARVKALTGLEPSVFEAEDPLAHVFTPAALFDRFGDFGAEDRAQIATFLEARGESAATMLKKPVVEQNATVPLPTASALFRDARFSPTHLESFASCRFAYYCDRILKLREDKNSTLGLSDTGTFLHHILEHVLLRVKQEGRPFGAWDTEEIKALTNELCADYRDELARVGGALTPRASALMDRLTRLAHLIVISLFEEFADSDFRPVLTEFDLRNTGAMPMLALGDGRTVPLSGKADRMDVWQNEAGEAFLRVVDYKTGSRAFSPNDIAKGFSLQMPLYLFALCAKAYPELDRTLGLDEGKVLRPAGVTYFSSAVSSENTSCLEPEDVALRGAMKRLSRSGVLLDDPDVKYAASHSEDPAIVGSSKQKRTLDREGFDKMFTDLVSTVTRLTDEMRGGVATAKPNREAARLACEYCRFAAICRVSQKERKGGD